MTAYCAGLMPIVCRDNPDRMMDYMLLFQCIMVEHGKGKHHWPILLHYIEQLRRRELMADAPSDSEEANKIRKLHRLSTHSHNQTLGLDNSILNESVTLWIAKSNVFLNDFLDPYVFKTLQDKSTPFEEEMSTLHRTSSSPSYRNTLPSSTPQRSSSSPSSSESNIRSTSNPRSLTNLPVGLTPQMAEKILKSQSPNNPCLNYLKGQCNQIGECPQKRPHWSLDEVKSKIH